MSEQLSIETYGTDKMIGVTVTLTEEGIAIFHPPGKLAGGSRRKTIPWAGIDGIRARNISTTWLASDWIVEIKLKRKYQFEDEGLMAMASAGLETGLPKVKNIKEVVLVMNQWLGRYGSPGK